MKGLWTIIELGFILFALAIPIVVSITMIIYRRRIELYSIERQNRKNRLMYATKLDHYERNINKGDPVYKLVHRTLNEFPMLRTSCVTWPNKMYDLDTFTTALCYAVAEHIRQQHQERSNNEKV